MFKAIKSIKNGASDLVDKHPKITKFYRTGLLNRFLVLILSLPILGVCAGVYYWMGYSFGEGEWAMGFIGVLLSMACVALLAKYLMLFSVLGLQSAKLGIKKRVNKISDYIDSVEEDEESRNEKSDLEDYKPHGIFDTAFGLLELAFFVVSTVGILVIPLIATGMFN